MAYMLVRLQVRYGMVRRFEEIMSHLAPILQKKGWRLHGAWVNRIGRLNTVYDLWEMPDANSVQSVLELAQAEPEFREWARDLGECLEDEQLELMDPASYWDPAR